MFRAFGSWFQGGLTNTTTAVAITALMPPRRGCFSRITSFNYLCGGTAHALTLMRPLGSTTLSAAVAASATGCTLTAQPLSTHTAGVIATNDWFVVQLDDGNYYVSAATVSTLTLSNMTAFPSAAAAGNTVWWLGAPGDHATAGTAVGQAVTALGATTQRGFGITAVVSVNNGFSDFAAGLMASFGQNEPLLFHSNNVTAAGTLTNISGVHTQN